MGALFACPIIASAVSGVIHFRGSIVEEACRVKPDNRVVHLSCYRDGKMESETQPLAPGIQVNMMSHIAATQFYTVDGHSNLHVLQITYR